jgi:hypothetical protein
MEDPRASEFLERPGRSESNASEAIIQREDERSQEPEDLQRSERRRCLGAHRGLKVADRGAQRLQRPVREGTELRESSGGGVSEVPERIAQAAEQRADYATISHPCQRLERDEAFIGVTARDGARERAQRNISVEFVGVDSPVGKLQTPGWVLAHRQDHHPLRLLHAGGHGGGPAPDDAVDGTSSKSPLRPSS